MTRFIAIALFLTSMFVGQPIIYARSSVLVYVEGEVPKDAFLRVDEDSSVKIQYMEGKQRSFAAVRDLQWNPAGRCECV